MAAAIGGYQREHYSRTMKKLFLGFLILGAGAIGLGALHRTRLQARTTTASNNREWQATTNYSAELGATASALREEVKGKRDRLNQASGDSNISPELFKLLDSDLSKGQSAAWTELRERLGLGWNSSDDYVLVSRRVLKQLNLHPINGPVTTRAVLAISPGEQ